jgi:hypothetical protein
MLREKTGSEWNTPMALPHEDTASPRDGTTGLQYKFQGSSATVTYSRFKSGAYLANLKRIALNRQPRQIPQESSMAAREPKARRAAKNPHQRDRNCNKRMKLE